jgi:hypothetical protein
MDDLDELEADGPFAITFLSDAKKVWAIRHAQYATSSAWQHVKKYSTTQNGRQVWRTLHTFFFGGDRVNTMYSDIISTLKTLFYSGDHKNYNLDKYCTAQVEQHNRLSALVEYGVQGLDEKMKIHYFKEGIKDDSFNSVKTMIPADCKKFLDFISGMNLYSNFKRSQKNGIAPQGRTISALTQGRGGGGRGRGGTGRGRGRGGNSRSSRIVPQEEVHKVTGIEAKHYPDEIYKTFTPAMKAKHWQLLHPGQTPGTGPAKGARGAAPAPGMTSQIAGFQSAMSIAATSISDFTAATQKRAADSDLTRDSVWGRNRDNTALGCQDLATKKPKN